MFDQTITIKRAPAVTNAAGTEAVQRDWANATATVVAGVHVQPVSSDDSADAAGVTATQRWLLVTAPGSGRLDLRSTDRVVYDGMTLDVDGPPRHWPGPDGGWHHTEATLTLEPLTRVGSIGGASAAGRAAATAAAVQAWSPR